MEAAGLFRAPGGNPEGLREFLAPLVEAGVDIFHCSTRRFWIPEFEGSELNLAGWTRELTGKPTITVGNVGLDGSEFLQFFGKTDEWRSRRASTAWWSAWTRASSTWSRWAARCVDPGGR